MNDDYSKKSISNAKKKAPLFRQRNYDVYCDRKTERERESTASGGWRLVFVRSSTVLTITSGFAITTILCRILLLANFKRDETQAP